MSVGALAQLDEALIRLRRLWQIPTARRADGVASPDLSTVLVADAIHRQRPAGGQEPVTVAAVAERLDVAASTASRLVDRACRAGMVNRTADLSDPRRAALTMTTAGKVLVRDALRFRTAYLDRVLDGWEAGDIEALADLLDRFAAAVHKHGLPTVERMER